MRIKEENYMMMMVTDSSFLGVLPSKFQSMWALPVAAFKYANKGRVSGPLTSLLLSMTPSKDFLSANSAMAVPSPGSWNPTGIRGRRKG